MSADTYSIHIKVDSSEAKKAGLDLDDLSAGSIQLKLSIEKLNEATKDSSRHFSESTKSVNKMADAYRNASGVIDSGTSIASRLGMASSTVAKEMKNISSSANSASSSVGQFAKSAQALHSAFVLIIGIELARFLRETVNKTREAADAYTEMTSRLSIATESQIELNKSFRDASEISKKYYGNLTDVASAYSKINPILAAMGREQGDTEKVVSSFSASLLVSGANVRDAAESFRQFSQAISGPVIQMEEMNTIIDSNQALWRGLNREFAPLVEKYGSLKNAISAQAISNQMLVEATIKLGDEFDALASKKVPTIANAITILSNKFVEYVGKADGTAGASKDISAAIVDLAENLDKVLDPFMKVATGLGTAAIGAGRLLANLGPLVEMIGSAAGVIAKDLGEIATSAADAGDALSALAGNIEDYKDVYEVNRAKGSDKVLEGINSEISETKRLLDSKKELQSKGNVFAAQEVENYERKLKKLNELKEAHFQQADAQKKAEREEMARIDQKRSKEASTPTAKIDENALKRSRDEAERNFSAILDFQLAQAENAEKIFEAQSKTKLEQIESEKKAIKDAAEVEIEGATTKEERLAVYLKMQQQLEEKIIQETGLRQELLQHDINLNQVRIDSANQLLAKSNEYQFSQAEILRIQKEMAASQTQIDIAPENSKQLEIDATEKLRSSAEEYNKELAKSADTQKDVREEALRTLEVMSSNLENAKSMAEGLAEAFGTVGESIGEMVVAMANYEKQMATIEIQKNEQLEKAKGDPKKRQQAEEDAAQKVAKTQVKAYGDMAQAAQGFFKKGTTGYNALGAAVKVFRAFEMAQSAMSIAKEIANISLKISSYIAGLTTETAANVASVGPNVAADGAKSTASAIEAIAKAAAAPFPVGFVTGAAMLAFMVGIGAMAAGAGGGGGSASVPVTPPTPGTGTVFGDSSAVSDSLGKSISRLEENSSNDLSYSSKMLMALYEIRDALKGVENSVAATITPTVETLKQMFPDGVTQAFMRFDPTSLERLRKTETIQGTGYARIDTVDKNGYKHGKDLNAELPKKLENAVGEAMLLVIDKSFNEIGKSIGVSAEKVQENLKGFMIKIGDISALGTAEETAKFIESAINANADKAAELAFPELKRFRQTGEGFSETAIRVADGVNRAKGSLALLGMQAVSYSELSDKTATEQADVASAIAKKTIISQSDLSKGAKQYVDELTGGLDEVISGYLQLKEINDLMRGTGIDPNNFSRAMAEAAGGLDKLTEALQSYQDNFFTDAEKVTSQASKMREEFSKFGFVMPKTRDEFRKMVESLNVDPVQQARLLTLAAGFDEMVTAADDLNASFTDLFDNITDFQDSINSQIASLTSVTATAELSATNLQKAYHNLFEAVGYFGQNITGSQSEIDLLSAVKSAIMDRYNSEMARLREVAQAQGEVLKAGLQLQIDAINASVTAQVDAINASVTAQVDAINAATDAEVNAINARLDAEIEARQAAHEEALKGLQSELEAANKLKSAIQQVRDYAKGLALGGSSPLSPEARLAESQRQYQDLLKKAQGGDADAISQLSGASQSYLDAARQYFGSGTQYTNIFDGVKQAMEQIGAMSAPDPDSIQSHIDDLRKSQSDELAQLREAAQSQIKATQEAAKDQIKSLQDSAKDQIKAIQDAAKDQIKIMQDDVNQAIKDLTDIDKNPAMKSLRDDTIAELGDLYLLSEKVRDEADKQAAAAKKILEDQRDYQKNQTDFMGRVAEAIAPVGKPSNQEQTMSDMLVEQRALVTAQTAANPEIIQNLASVDKRLATIERNLRIA